jgi:hypothetical protein
MATQNNPDDNLLSSRSWREAAISVAASLFVSIASLFIEYKTGIFQPAGAPSAGPPLLTTYFIAFAAFSLFLTGALLAYSILLLIRCRAHFREQFALAALATMLGAALLLLALPAGLMPWSVPACVIALLQHRAPSVAEARWTDFALLFAIYFALVRFLIERHRRWRGLRSLEEYAGTQRGETPILFRQGVDELKRIAQRRPPRQAHIAQSQLQRASQLEPVRDSVAWKDRARELLKLSSTSYLLEQDGWRDSVGCWVGSNLDTGKLLVLAPFSSYPDEASLHRVVSFAEEAAKQARQSIDSIVVAVRQSLPELLPPTGRRVVVKTEGQLLEGLVNFTDYFHEIRRRFEHSPLPDSHLSLNDVYVPAQILQPDPGGDGRSVESVLSDWLDEPGHRQLALLGEYGQGKSTTALAWTHRLISNVASAGAASRIPLLIELRGTSPRNLTPLQLLGAWAAQYGINPQALVALAIAGRLVLIFEGFDEMALVGDAEMRLKHFRTLWRFAYPGSKILITGRPNFFLDDREMKAALGIGTAAGDRPFCEALRLKPFSLEQIEEALRSYRQEVRSQICALVARSARFHELVSRPSLLHVVAVLWERERLATKEDQLTSAFVMNLFVQNSYRRQGLKETDSQGFMALTTAERDYFMAGIAAFMAAKSLPNQISADQLGVAISTLISYIPESISVRSTAISGETVRPLSARLTEAEYGVEHVATDVRTCGLLADDPAAAGTFRFGHKSFFEFLFAQVLTEQVLDSNSERAGAILSATGARLENIALYPVSIGFLAEMLVGEDRIFGKDISEGALAERLLERLVGFGHGLRRHVSRAIVFNEAVAYLCMKSSRKGLRIFAFPMLASGSLLFTLPLLGVFFALVGEHVDVSLIVAAVGVLLISSLLYSISSWSTDFRPRFRLWLYVCKSLGIRDDTLHDVVGSARLPWIRSESWHFLEPDSRSVEPEESVHDDLS